MPRTKKGLNQKQKLQKIENERLNRLEAGLRASKANGPIQHLIDELDRDSPTRKSDIKKLIHLLLDIVAIQRERRIVWDHRGECWFSGKCYNRDPYHLSYYKHSCLVE